MFEIINEKTLPEFSAFVESHPKGHFLQSREWGRVKEAWTWQAIAVRGADAVEAWERDKTQMPVTEEPPRKRKPIRHIQLVDGYRIPRRKEI